MSRPVYGFVYELILAGQSEGDHNYVGKRVGRTEAAITSRVHGKSASAHTSPQSIARDPWKADVLPGRAGWRKLETIYDCDDPAENDRALRRAEADWIRRLNPRHNDVRPVKRIGGDRRPGRAPAAPRPARHRSRRSVAKPAFLALFTIAYTILVARLMVAMALPWASAPWVVSPAAGLVLGWRTVFTVCRMLRRLK